MNTSPRGLSWRAVTAASSIIALASLSACGESGSSGEGGGDPLSSGAGIIVPSDPGGGYDQTARALSETLTAEDLAGQIQVTNTPGAGGTVALASYVNQDDPSQLMVAGLSLVGAVVTNDSAHQLSDVTPIAQLIGEYEVIVVPADSEHADLKGYMESLKADPGAHPIAIGNQGGVDHMWGATLVQEANAPLDEVNFVTFDGGGEVTTALLGNQVSAGISGYGEFAQQIEAGELRVLAVSSEEPIDIAPDAPTVVDQGFPGSVMVNWRGIFAPPGISDEDRQTLSDTFEALNESDAWTEVREARGWSDEFLPTEEFETRLKEEEETVVGLLEELGLA